MLKPCSFFTAISSLTDVKKAIGVQIACEAKRFHALDGAGIDVDL